jgi:hypothetical protein
MSDDVDFNTIAKRVENLLSIASSFEDSDVFNACDLGLQLSLIFSYLRRSITLAHKGCYVNPEQVLLVIGDDMMWKFIQDSMLEADPNRANIPDEVVETAHRYQRKLAKGLAECNIRVPLP